MACDLIGSAYSTSGGAHFRTYFNVNFPDAIQFHVQLTKNDYRVIRIQSGINDKNWHHLVIVRKSNNMSIYVDGIEENTVVTSSGGSINGTIQTNTSMQIGKCGGVNEGVFNGDIDDVRIYSRSLSKAEVETLYHEGGW